jgi:ABC-type cobalamin/Fe3+-siderophores transport system ATPase subunit
MRLDKVSIDGFKNLRGLELDFDERQLTTVLIGQNGAGKSNLIEAITQVFRWVDLRRNEPRFRYRVTYRIQPQGPAVPNPPSVCLSNFAGEPAIQVNGQEVKRAEFEKRKAEWFPDLVFGYYSGGSRRLEALFDSHQRRYYDHIKLEDDDAKVAKAQEARRLFYCRPIHGVLALLALFAFPDRKVTAELASRLGITGFHSLLALFRRPSWFKGPKDAGAEDLWGAKGPAGRAARRFKELAFHPFAWSANQIDDYRDRMQSGLQLAAFIPSLERMQELAMQFNDEHEMFYALEAMDISDLVREIQVWVTRNNDASGDVGFADLSDGERQLLMVLGLIRVSRGKRALFLLDEPDTHLNPHWQHSYLKLIEDWTGIAAEKEHCHIVLTSHNPLTISALSRDEVRVINMDATTNAIVAEPPFVDPRGLGIGGVLTDIFGMPSTLDQPTQDLLAARNRLARLDEPTDEQLVALDAVNERLRELGFMYEERDELYRKFLRRLDAAEFTVTDPRSPAELQRRELIMSHVIEELLRGNA